MRKIPTLYASREDNGGDWCKECERYFLDPHSHDTVSGPHAEHIDAVARAIDPATFDNESLPIMRMILQLDAARLLDSTDPTVHAAMLDALTRAGVLTEETARLFDGFGGQIDGKPVGRTGTAIRRFVTEWERRP